MDTANPLSTLLKQILNGGNANHLYAVFNGNVQDDRFALAKKAFNSLLQTFSYSAQTPHPTTVTIMQAAAANSVPCDKQTDLANIKNLLQNMAKANTGPDMDASLQVVKTEAAAVAGNKTVFIFTDSNVNAKPVIDQMITDGIHVLCFVISDDPNLDIAAITNTFNVSRFIVLKSLVEVENFFEKITLENIEPPTISSKSSSTNEIFLTIRSTEPFDEYEVYGYIAGAKEPTLMGTTTAKKITLGDLKPNQKYYLKVRGKKALKNTFSQFSKDEVVHTIATTEFNKKIQDEVECRNELHRLRTKIRNFRIPGSLAKTGLKHFNVILFSEMGNGKSSFVNTLQTALQNDDIDPFQSAKAGVGQESFTRKISKFSVYGITPIKIWDTFGKQVNKEYTELKALTQGKLREGFTEGSQQEDTNKFFKSESDINNTPHAYLILCDIWGVHDPDKVREFKELNKVFKQDTGVPTLSAVTKFDLLNDDENEPLLKGNLNKICEKSQILEIIQQFAKDAGISAKDVFPILNYLGASEERSPVKDLLALHLLDKIITNIETHFRAYRVLNIVDQSDKFITAVLLESLDMSLADFETDFFRRLTTDDFKPIGLYYQGQKQVHEREYKSMSLEDIVYDELNSDDGYVNYTVKIENKLCESISNNNNNKKGKMVHISYHPSLSKESQEIKCEKETLRLLRKKLEIPSKFVFSKRSVSERGTFDEDDEATTLVIDVIDSENRLYIVQQQTPAPPEPARTNIKCEKCDFKISSIFKEKIVSEMRKELDSKANNHPNYVFLTNDGYEVPRSDENEMKIDELVYKNDLGKDQILLKCL